MSSIASVISILSNYQSDSMQKKKGWGKRGKMRQVTLKSQDYGWGE
jgi:hypothetical protein